MQKESVLVLLGLLILGLSLFWGIDGGVTGKATAGGSCLNELKARFDEKTPIGLKAKKYLEKNSIETCGDSVILTCTLQRTFFHAKYDAIWAIKEKCLSFQKCKETNGNAMCIQKEPEPKPPQEGEDCSKKKTKVCSKDDRGYDIVMECSPVKIEGPFNKLSWQHTKTCGPGGKCVNGICNKCKSKPSQEAKAGSNKERCTWRCSNENGAEKWTCVQSRY